MSRSYKHSSFVVDNKGHNLRRRYFKRYHNKAIRNKLNNSDELMQGSIHKKYTNSWDICDYRWYWSEEQAVIDYYQRYNEQWWFRENYPTLEDWLKHYNKEMRYK